MKRILFADNDPEFLRTQSNLLQLAGYHVLEVTTLAEAELCLREKWFPLIILDIGLVDDTDEDDTSGLSLAKTEGIRSLTKIMLNKHKYLTPEMVREALRSQKDGRPLAVNILTKEEGSNALLGALNQAFEKDIHIDWGLVICWNEIHPLSFPHLASLIEPGLQAERIVDQASELEDLFRSLFYGKSQVTLDRLIWQRQGRIAVTGFTFTSDKLSESFVVICGPTIPVQGEFQNYNESASAATSPLRGLAKTTHFAAYACPLPGFYLENTQTLFEFYHSNPERKLFQAVMTSLQLNLKAWHRDQRVIVEQKASEAQLYRAKLDIDSLEQAEFQKRVLALQGEAARHGVTLKLEDEAIGVYLTGTPAFSVQNPFLYLDDSTLKSGPVICTIAPGTLTPENILIALDGQTWLTDFSGIGLAPLLWNFIVLEATVRFDLVESDDLVQLYEMEQRLTGTGKIGGVDTRDVNKPIRTALQFIEMIRRAASELSNDVLSYHLGLFFCAASRVAAFQPSARRMRRDIVLALHAFLAMGMICEKVLNTDRDSSSMASMGIEVDLINQFVRVDGREVSLSQTEFKLLTYLYEHAGRLCSRKDVFEHVWENEKYEAINDNYNRRLDTNINRLRKKLELNTSVPRYLFVKRGLGYTLLKQPKT